MTKNETIDMRTELLYTQNSYLDKIQTKVLKIIKDKHLIEIEKTIVYPGGGGQPADIAFVNEKEIKSIIIDNGQVYYQLGVETLKSISLESEIQLTIDWDYRFTLMQLHTVQHVFAGYMINKYDTEIAGNTISYNNSHIDFKLSMNFSKDLCDEIDLAINSIIERNYPIIIQDVTFTQAKNLLSSSRTNLEKLKNLDIIRIVSIGDYDSTACSGLHVNNTKEIKKFTINKFKSKGKYRKRFYYQ